MSNLGFERYLDGLGLELVRTAVGDRNVVDYMRTHDHNVGGEQSGHIILNDEHNGRRSYCGSQVLASVIGETGRSAKSAGILMHCRRYCEM